MPIKSGDEQRRVTSVLNNGFVTGGRNTSRQSVFIMTSYRQSTLHDVIIALIDQHNVMNKMLHTMALLTSTAGFVSCAETTVACPL